MTTITQTTIFDYAALDTETRIVVQQRTSEIKALMKRAASDIIEIGQKLIEVKERLGHGGFMGWLECEFTWDDRTARRFMSVAEQFKMDNLSNLMIAPSALYLLAAPSTPETARIEAIARAEEGEAITHALARGIVADHRSPAIPFVPEEDELTPYEEQIAEAYQERWERPAPEAEYISTPDRNTHIMRVMGSSESPEWYTPGYIVDLVLQFFEIITVDPCSNSKEQPNVPASILYTKADDGLSRPWCGNVYMNPPYGDEIGQWVDRMVEFYRSGDVDQAVALLPGRIDTQWFQPLYDYPICNVRGRVKFQNSDNSAPFPSVIVYLGADEEGFIETFKHLGPIVKRIA